MTLSNSDPVVESLRTLWHMRNTWDPRLRGIVRELLRADFQHLRTRSQVKK